MARYSIEIFYSKKISLIFLAIYGSIYFFVLAIDAIYFSLMDGSAVTSNALMYMSIGGFAGGFAVMQKYQPTRITVKDRDFFYVAKDVEYVISKFHDIFLNERNFYGFVWGYEKKYLSEERIMLIPRGSPKYPNGIAGPYIHNLIFKLTKYPGITPVVEISKNGTNIEIYGTVCYAKKSL